jgi:hypothetical protein
METVQTDLPKLVIYESYKKIIHKSTKWLNTTQFLS